MEVQVNNGQRKPIKKQLSKIKIDLQNILKTFIGKQYHRELANARNALLSEVLEYFVNFLKVFFSKLF